MRPLQHLMVMVWYSILCLLALLALLWCHKFTCSDGICLDVCTS